MASLTSRSRQELIRRCQVNGNGAATVPMRQTRASPVRTSARLNTRKLGALRQTVTSGAAIATDEANAARTARTMPRCSGCTVSASSAEHLLLRRQGRGRVRTASQDLLVRWIVLCAIRRLRRRDGMPMRRVFLPRHDQRPRLATSRPQHKYGNFFSWYLLGKMASQPSDPR